METVTRIRCAETGYLHDGRCHTDPDRTEECACEARVFEVVRLAGWRPQLLPLNESAGRDEGIVRPADPDPGRSR